jgi:RNA polymerase sigma-70 factor (ECF subfamily)
MDFSGLYTRYARDVYRFAVWLSADPVLAEDLTSETFVHALCAPAPLRLDTVKAYLFAITRNLYRDFTDRHRQLTAMGGVQEPADPVPSTQCTIENRQVVDSVLRAIQRLPKSQREALVLAIDGDLQYEQIAVILGCSLAAVKVRIHRARLQLKADLDEQENSTCKE